MEFKGPNQRLRNSRPDYGAAMDEPSLSKLGEYDVHEELGQDASAVVYRGWHRIFPVLVARAVMPISKQMPESISVLSYIQAAQVRAGRLFHEHIFHLCEFVDDAVREADKIKHDG